MNTILTKSKNAFISSVFLQMFVALLITIGVSLATVMTRGGYAFVSNYYTLIIVGQLLFVFFLGARMYSMAPATAKLMLFAYSAINGMLISFIYIVYDLFSILTIFSVTAIIFLAMSIYGARTKEDLSKYSTFFKFGLLGLVIVSLINLFVGAPLIYWMTGVFGIILFTALIAYDINRIYRIFSESGLSDEELQTVATIGALNLYLDFINLMLSLLRIFGRRK